MPPELGGDGMTELRRMILSMTGLEDENMGKWELIKEITIDETKMNISVTEDNDGNPFRLIGVEIFVISATTELTVSGTISACMTPTRISPSNIGVAAMSNEDKRYCYGLFEKKAMGVEYIRSYQSVNANTALNNMNIINTAGSLLCDDSGIICPDICEGIWIGSHYQNVLSPGTIIKIYGVRE